MGDRRVMRPILPPLNRVRIIMGQFPTGTTGALPTLAVHPPTNLMTGMAWYDVHETWPTHMAFILDSYLKRCLWIQELRTTVSPIVPHLHPHRSVSEL